MGKITKIQFTFTDVENRYRPITVTLVARPTEKYSQLRTRAVKKVCAERDWSMHDMLYKYGYRSCIHRYIRTED